MSWQVSQQPLTHAQYAMDGTPRRLMFDWVCAVIPILVMLIVTCGASAGVDAGTKWVRRPGHTRVGGWVGRGRGGHLHTADGDVVGVGSGGRVCRDGSGTGTPALDEALTLCGGWSLLAKALSEALPFDFLLMLVPVLLLLFVPGPRPAAVLTMRLLLARGLGTLSPIWYRSR